MVFFTPDMNKGTRLSLHFISHFVTPFWKTLHLFIWNSEYFGIFCFFSFKRCKSAVWTLTLWHAHFYRKRHSTFERQKFASYWKIRIKANKVIHMKIQTSYLLKIWSKQEYMTKSVSHSNQPSTNISHMAFGLILEFRVDYGEFVWYRFCYALFSMY